MLWGSFSCEWSDHKIQHCSGLRLAWVWSTPAVSQRGDIRWLASAQMWSVLSSDHSQTTVASRSRKTCSACFLPTLHHKRCYQFMQVVVPVKMANVVSSACVTCTSAAMLLTLAGHFPSGLESRRLWDRPGDQCQWCRQSTYQQILRSKIDTITKCHLSTWSHHLQKWRLITPIRNLESCLSVDIDWLIVPYEHWSTISIHSLVVRRRLILACDNLDANLLGPCSQGGIALHKFYPSRARSLMLIRLRMVWHLKMSV